MSTETTQAPPPANPLTMEAALARLAEQIRPASPAAAASLRAGKPAFSMIVLAWVLPDGLTAIIRERAHGDEVSVVRGEEVIAGPIAIPVKEAPGKYAGLPPLMFADPTTALEYLAEDLWQRSGGEARNALQALRESLPVRPFEYVSRQLPDGYSVRVVSDRAQVWSLAIYRGDRLRAGPAVVDGALGEHIDRLRLERAYLTAPDLLHESLIGVLGYAVAALRKQDLELARQNVDIVLARMEADPSEGSGRAEFLAQLQGVRSGLAERQEQAAAKKESPAP